MNWIKPLGVFMLFFVLSTAATPVYADEFAGTRVHVVQSGETLYRIGRSHGVAWTVLAEYNGLANPHLIFPGQRVKVPGGMPVSKPNSVLSIVQAQNILEFLCGCAIVEYRNPLIISRCSGCYIAVHVPELNRIENDVIIYGFILDFSASSVTMGNTKAYAWINGITGIIYFEEYGYRPGRRNYYANIPDVYFPIPMKNGVPIQYDNFNPPITTQGVTYIFSDLSVAKIYMEQLLTAGFVGFDRYQSAMAVDWEWSYRRASDGANLTVLMHFSERLVMIMTAYILPLKVSVK